MTALQREEVHRLWDSLPDFPVAETEPALVHLMAGIANMIAAG